MYTRSGSHGSNEAFATAIRKVARTRRTIRTIAQYNMNFISVFHSVPAARYRNHQESESGRGNARDRVCITRDLRRRKWSGLSEDDTPKRRRRIVATTAARYRGKRKKKRKERKDGRKRTNRRRQIIGLSWKVSAPRTPGQ